MVAHHNFVRVRPFLHFVSYALMWLNTAGTQGTILRCMSVVISFKHHVQKSAPTPKDSGWCVESWLCVPHSLDTVAGQKVYSLDHVPGALKQ